MSPSGADRLIAGWAMLSAPIDQQLQAYDLEETVGGVPCRIAVDSGGARHLLIPLESPSPILPAPRQNLDVSIRWLKFGSSQSAMLDLSCAEVGVGREFDEVIADVLAEVAESPDVQSSAMACIGRWRRLFRSSRFGALSPEGRVGLFAELSVLLALFHELGEDALAYWTGPLRTTHDFEMPAACWEVKGFGLDSSAITIHGINQLATHDGRELQILLISVQNTTDGSTLDDLILQLEKATTKRQELDDLLSLTGWTIGVYLDRYVTGDVRRVPVVSELPQLTPSKLVSGSLDHGIDRVQYSLGLDVLLPFGRPTTIEQFVRGVVE